MEHEKLALLFQTMYDLTKTKTYHTKIIFIRAKNVKTIELLIPVQNKNSQRSVKNTKSILSTLRHKIT